MPNDSMVILAPLRVPTENTFTQTNSVPHTIWTVSHLYLVRCLVWVLPRVTSLVLGATSRHPGKIIRLLANSLSSFTPDGSWTHLRASLLVWLHAVITIDGNGKSLVCMDTPTQVPMHRELVGFRWQLVTTNLPTLVDKAIQSGAEQISAAIVAGVQAYTNAREEERQQTTQQD